MQYPPPTDFMPHQPPMLFVDRLLEHDELSVVVEKTFRAGDLFVVDGAISAFVTLELFAQAAAAHFGYAGLVRGGALSSGALLGTRRIELHVPRFEAGRRLVVRASQVFAKPPAAQYECVLLDATDPEEKLLAEGTINVAMGGPPPS